MTEAKNFIASLLILTGPTLNIASASKKSNVDEVFAPVNIYERPRRIVFKDDVIYNHTDKKSGVSFNIKGDEIHQ